MIKHNTLFKRTNTGAVQIWYIESEDNKYRTVSGQKDGKHVVSEWTTCVGKNKGRSNETTDEQQCQSEVASLYKKKLAQGGYKVNESEIDSTTFFEPMLADKLKDRPLKDSDFINGVFSQPKYDGMRCIIDKNGMWSRQGKPIISAPHIFDALKDYFNEDPLMVFDGELYNHELKDNFNELMSLAKQTKPTADDLQKSKEKLKFYCYDYFSTLPFGRRMEELDRIFNLEFKNQNYVVQVPTTQIHNKEELDKMFVFYIQNGYEGQMIRLNGPYETKRSKFLLKNKEFQDAEFKIVDILEGSGNRSGMAGTVMYETCDGKQFGSGIQGGVDFYREVWSQKQDYIGGEGTVRFFQYTPDGVPRFPVTVALFKGERDV